MTESGSHREKKGEKTLFFLFTGNLIPAVAYGPGWLAGKPISETLSWDP